MGRILALLVSCPLFLVADLKEIQKEPSLERRFELALAQAETSLKEAKALLPGGEIKQLEEALDEAASAAELSLQALRETGKRPSKLSKQYKRGELKTRQYIRQLEDLEKALGLQERPLAAKAKDRVTITHEEYLLGVMSKD
jgi:multidrug resistance efflux pump